MLKLRCYRCLYFWIRWWYKFCVSISKRFSLFACWYIFWCCCFWPFLLKKESISLDFWPEFKKLGIIWIWFFYLNTFIFLMQISINSIRSRFWYFRFNGLLIPIFQHILIIIWIIIFKAKIFIILILIEIVKIMG